VILNERVKAAEECQELCFNVEECDAWILKKNASFALEQISKQNPKGKALQVQNMAACHKFFF